MARPVVDRRLRNRIRRWRMVTTGAGLAIVALVAWVALPARTVTVTYESAPPAEPFVVTTPDGEVLVDEAYLVLASVALEECDDSHLGLLDRWRGVFGLQVAGAAHGSAGAAPGQLDGPLVVPLVVDGSTGGPVDTALGHGSVGAWSFCRLHLSAGQSTAAAEAGVSSGDGVDLSGLTLHVSGTRADDATIAWSWESSAVSGAFVDIEPRMVVAHPATVRIAFDLQAAFETSPGDGAADLATLLRGAAIVGTDPGRG